jgi:molybdopterin-guanine dinucleotide biosynthesis protein A
MTLTYAEGASVSVPTGGRRAPEWERSTLTGLVLAGGLSRRMGRDKALITHEGVPFVEHVAGRLARVCAEVVIAPGRVGRLGRLRWREVADATPRDGTPSDDGAGPLAGVIAGMSTASTPLVAVVAVDMPACDPDVIVRLASLGSGADGVVPVVDRRVQPLHAVYAVTAAPRLRRQFDAGERSITAAVDRLAVRYADVSQWGDLDPTGGFARNVNTPEELVRW